jgi:hypothetical protein
MLKINFVSYLMKAYFSTSSMHMSNDEEQKKAFIISKYFVFSKSPYWKSMPTMIVDK